MYGILLVSDLFIRLGYTVSAIILLIWLAVQHKKNKSLIASLASVSNGVLAFYALCYTLLFFYAYFTQGGYDDGPNQIHKTSIRIIFILGYLWVCLAMAFPWIRNRPLWILIPFVIIINAYKFIGNSFVISNRAGYHEASWLGNFFSGFVFSRSAFGVFLVLAGIYFMLVLCLYMFGKWVRKFAETPPAP